MTIAAAATELYKIDVFDRYIFEASIVYCKVISIYVRVTYLDSETTAINNNSLNKWHHQIKIKENV